MPLFISRRLQHRTHHLPDRQLATTLETTRLEKKKKKFIPKIFSISWQKPKGFLPAIFPSHARERHTFTGITKADGKPTKRRIDYVGIPIDWLAATSSFKVMCDFNKESQDAK